MNSMQTQDLALMPSWLLYISLQNPHFTVIDTHFTSNLFEFNYALFQIHSNKRNR